MANVRKRPVMEDTPKSKKDNNFNLPLESDEDAKKRRPRRCRGICLCLVLTVMAAVAVIIYIGSISDDITLGYFGDNTKDVYNRKVAEEIKNTVGEDGKQPDFPTPFEKETVPQGGDNLKQTDIDAGVGQGDLGAGEVVDDGSHVVEMKQHVDEVPDTREQGQLPEENVQAAHGEDQQIKFEHEHIEARGPQSLHMLEPHPAPARSKNLAPSSDKLADLQYPQPPSVAQGVMAPSHQDPQPPEPVDRPQDADVPSPNVDHPDPVPPQDSAPGDDSVAGIGDQPVEPIEQNLPVESDPVNVENIVRDDINVPEPAHLPGEM